MAELNGILRSINTQGTITGVSFINKNIGWISLYDSYGQIYHTINGGETWSYQTSTSFDYLNSIMFIDSLNGWSVGTDGKILGTSNGGINWNSLLSNTTNELYDVFL